MTEAPEDRRPWWWLSFAEEGADGKFLGGGFAQGITASHALVDFGPNPSGEVQVQPMPQGWAPPEDKRGRLLPLAECEALREVIQAAFLRDAAPEGSA